MSWGSCLAVCLVGIRTRIDKTAVDTYAHLCFYKRPNLVRSWCILASYVVGLYVEAGWLRESNEWSPEVFLYGSLELHWYCIHLFILSFYIYYKLFWRYSTMRNGRQQITVQTEHFVRQRPPPATPITCGIIIFLKYHIDLVANLIDSPVRFLSIHLLNPSAHVSS